MAESVNENYNQAKKTYAVFGVDTDKVLEAMKKIQVSLHCWQGDDVTGFETGVDGLSGARATLKAIMFSLLEPSGMLNEEEEKGNLGSRLALMEEFKSLPFGAVWNKYYTDNGAPAGAEWLQDVKEYEESVLLKRV